MLCGAVWSAAPVYLRGLAPPLPPRPALLAALVMQALQDRVDDESSFLVASLQPALFEYASQGWAGAAAPRCLPIASRDSFG
ncbi:unnamed protein product, partial [Iphiclides podalirius]